MWTMEAADKKVQKKKNGIYAEVQISISSGNLLYFSVPGFPLIVKWG